MNRQQLEKILYEEAMARCRYEVYADIARSEGLHYYAKVLDETAKNELSHVRQLMILLNLGGSTKDNLEKAISNERSESKNIYPSLHDDAIAENDLETARLFQQIGKIESRHQERFEKLHRLLVEEKAFRRDKAILWKCRVCGFIYEGTAPPLKCPACQSLQNFFEPDDFAI